MTWTRPDRTCRSGATTSLGVPWRAATTSAPRSGTRTTFLLSFATGRASRAFAAERSMIPSSSSSRAISGVRLGRGPELRLEGELPGCALHGDPPQLGELLESRRPSHPAPSAVLHAAEGDLGLITNRGVVYVDDA